MTEEIRAIKQHMIRMEEYPKSKLTKVAKQRFINEIMLCHNWLKEQELKYNPELYTDEEELTVGNYNNK